MSDAPDRHGDLAAYLMGGLNEAERLAFERAAARDEELRNELRELTTAVVLAERAAEPFEVPDGLASRVRASVVAAAADAPAPKPAQARSASAQSWWGWPRRLALAGALALTLAAGVLAGTRIGDDELAAPVGNLEVSATMRAPGGEAAGTIDVRARGIGREIAFRSEALPILPKGQYYEVWFVGPGDSREAPNRISAGTFHPDEQGRSAVEFTAAVDPALYPVIEITAEPGDGDPGPTGEVVARLDSSP